MDGITGCILRAAMQMVFAADGVGNRTAAPAAIWQLTTSASGWTSVAAVGTNHVAYIRGLDWLSDFMRESR